MDMGDTLNTAFNVKPMDKAQLQAAVKDQEIEKLADIYAGLIIDSLKEFRGDFERGQLARTICNKILKDLDVEDMGGCPLCTH